MLNKAKSIYNVLIYGFIFGAIIGLILYYAFPAYYTNLYLVVLGFFLVVESFIMFLIHNQVKGASDRQMVNTYLLAKTIKTILALVVIGIYAAIVKDKALVMRFSLWFILLYIVFLVIESKELLKIEKHKKNKEL